MELFELKKNYDKLNYSTVDIKYTNTKNNILSVLFNINDNSF